MLVSAQILPYAIANRVNHRLKSFDTQFPFEIESAVSMQCGD